jgi:NAD(P)-dependent dehydrogenase (short-subunit alcohol dehydrogenase family)
MGHAAYSASKGAIDSMTLPMARDFGPHGIRVLTIAPAGFDTPMGNSFGDKVVAATVPKTTVFPRRLGIPEEFSSTVLWALQTPYVNGETIRLTAGSRFAALR